MIPDHMSVSSCRLVFHKRVVLWTLPSWQKEDRGSEFDFSKLKNICPQMYVLKYEKKQEI